MAVIENLDIVLGAKTQQADAAIRNSVNEMRSITTEVSNLSGSMTAFEPITVAITSGISDLLATIPGVSAGIAVFQTTATLIQAMFAAHQANGAKQIASAIAEVKAETRDAVQELRIMERELHDVANAADDIIDVDFEVMDQRPLIGNGGGRGLITRSGSDAMGLSRTVAGAAGSVDDQRRYNQAVDESIAKTKNYQSSWVSAGGASRTASAVGIAGAATLAVGVGAAIAAVAGLAIAWGKAREQAAVIDDLADASSKLGMTVRDLSTMRLSLGETSGLDDGAIDNALQKMTIGLSDAATKQSGPLHERLSSIGLEAGELLKLGPVKAMEEIMQRTQELQSPTDQLTLAYELFGKQGAALVSSLRDGPEALQDMADWADKTGMSVSNAQAESVGAANDAWGRLEMVATGAFRQIAAESSPVLQVMFEQITDGVEGFSGYLTHLPAIVDNTVYFAGVIYDVVELSQVLHTSLYNIVTLNWSEVGQDIESAFTFDTGRKNIEAIQKARDDAAEAAAGKAKYLTNSESEFAAYEAQKQAAKEAEEAAKEATRVKEQAEQEQAKAIQRSQEAIQKKTTALQQEIEIQRLLGSLSAKQAEEQEQEIRERIALHAELRESGLHSFEQIDELTKQADDLRKANEERNRLSSRAEELNRQFDPAIELRETINELNRLRESGLIDSSVYTRATMEAMQKDTPQYKGAVSAQSGSVEAYRLLLDRENSNREHDVAMRRVAEESLGVSRNMLAAMSSIQTVGRAR